MTSAAPESPSEWLPGVWRSDRERTVQAWGEHAPGSAEFKSILLRDLGTLEVSYAAGISVSNFNGEKTSGEYRIVWQSSDQAFVVSRNEDGESGQHLFFECPTVFWVHVGRFVEFFQKVR
jgi:hypothetical protein